MKDKIIIIGAYGCGNKGDDAILEGFQHVLGKEWELIPTCGNYGNISKIIGAKNKIISCRMNEGVNSAVLINLLKFFPSYFRHIGHADAIIIGGGSLLHDITKYNLPFFFLLQLLAQIRRKKVIYAGVGVGPLQTSIGKKYLKKYLNKSSGVFVRDPFDYNLLKDIGVSEVILSADMAFCTETDFHAADKILDMLALDKGEYIVMTACQWFKSDNFWNREHMNFLGEKTKLLGAIRRLIKIYGKKIVFLPTVFHDYKLGKMLEKELDSSDFIVIDHTYNCKEMASIVANSWLLFGVRMHSIIFAIRSGVPFLATIYDDKVLHLLKRVGMEDYAVEFEKIDTDEFEVKMYKMLDCYDDIAEKLKEQAMHLRNIVFRDANTIREIIQQ